ncbi:MAG: DUF2849 domain-containing protein [Pseudomonadota bacterium]
MAKQQHPMVLTANNLVEGHSVFLTPDGWHRDIARAMVAVTPEQAGELEALGKRHVTENEIVGPYLVDVMLGDAGPVPVQRREQIRAAGIPTIPVGNAARDRVAA